MFDEGGKKVVGRTTVTEIDYAGSNNHEQAGGGENSGPGWLEETINQGAKVDMLMVCSG